MKLNLKNPLIFFDLETTGIDIVNDRIVQIAYLKVYPNGKEESKTYLVNPTVPINPKSIEIHGITDEMVKNEPTFTEIGKTLVQVFEGSDFGGYNLNKFDLPLLAEEFLRAGIDFDLKKRKVIDVQVIFHKMEQRTLSAAYKFYCKKEMENAHDAAADTLATYEILQSQLDTYDNLKNDVDELSKFSAHNRNVDFVGRIILDDKDREVFNFGKYKGKAVEDVLKKDPGYYGWIINSDFPLYTKKVLTNIKLRAAFNE